MTVTALLDWDTMEIADGCWIAVALLAVAAAFTLKNAAWPERLIGALAVSVPMLLLTLLIADAFGGGDIKLMAAGGLFLGWKLILAAAALAILGGGLYGGYLLAAKKKGRKDHFAFGPFLCAGMALSLLFGQSLIDWYIGFLIY